MRNYTCKICNINKLASDFPRDKQSSMILDFTCHKCLGIKPPSKYKKKIGRPKKPGPKPTNNHFKQGGITWKHCSKCGKPWPLYMFPWNRTKRDIHDTVCKPCRRENARGRYYKNKQE
jgi:hypothetical protein